MACVNKLYKDVYYWLWRQNRDICEFKCDTAAGPSKHTPQPQERISFRLAAGITR